MEELVGNAILKPSKEHKVGRNLPNFQLMIKIIVAI